MLKQTIANIEFQNPIVASSGCFGFGLEYTPFFDTNILGGITLQTVTLQPKLPLPANRIAEVKSGLVRSTAWENPGVSHIIKTKGIFEKRFTNAIIASIGGDNEADYKQLAQELTVLDYIAAIEINVSCLNTPAEFFSYQDILNIVKAVKLVSTKPVFLKLQPFAFSLEKIIKDTQDLGIDGFTLINNVPGMRIDSRLSKKPILSTKIGGLGGGSLMSIALATVFKARQYTQLPIIGTGGVDTMHDALEFLMAGANLVGIGSGFFKNPLCAKEIIENLPSYLEQNRYKHITDIIGIAQ